MYKFKTKAGGTVSLSGAFEQSLRDHRVLTKAVQNMKKAWATFRITLTIPSLHSAFLWEGTPEGYAFWIEINGKINNTNRNGDSNKR